MPQDRVINAPAKPVPVLFVLTDLRVGGMERKVAEIVQCTNPQLIKPVIACMKEAGPLAPEVRAAGIEVYANLLRHKFDLLVLWRLVRLIRLLGIKVVCTVGDGGDRMFWGRLAARLAGVEGIVSTHHSTRNPSGGRIIDRPNRWLTPWNDAYVAVAKSAGKYLVEQEDLPAKKVVVIYNGVEPDRYNGENRTAARAALGLADDEPTIVHVAALRPEKAHDVLLKAAKIVVAQVPQAKFLMVGGGDLQASIEAERDQMGLADNVQLLGRRSDIPELLAAADISVLCSYPMVETFPNSVLEAMSSRKPVVCTNVGSIAEQITDGVEGYLIESGDHQALAERFLTLIKDPVLRQQMGERGRQVVIDNFSTARMVGDREQLFLSLAAGNGIPEGIYSMSVEDTP